MNVCSAFALKGDFFKIFNCIKLDTFWEDCYSQLVKFAECYTLSGAAVWRYAV
jgi:hypothetical protein